MPTLIDRSGSVLPWPWRTTAQLLEHAAATDPELARDSAADQGGTLRRLVRHAIEQGGTDGSPLYLLLDPDEWEALGPLPDTLPAAQRGLLLRPGDDPADVLALTARAALIAVQFPHFTDGRGYSIARLLRSRHHWQGPLVAVGDIARDTLFYQSRVGFDGFLLREQESVEVARSAFSDFHERYQASQDGSALFERRQAV